MLDVCCGLCEAYQDPKTLTYNKTKWKQAILAGSLEKTVYRIFCKFYFQLQILCIFPKHDRFDKKIVFYLCKCKPKSDFINCLSSHGNRKYLQLFFTLFIQFIEICIHRIQVSNNLSSNLIIINETIATTN